MSKDAILFAPVKRYGESYYPGDSIFSVSLPRLEVQEHSIRESAWSSEFWNLVSPLTAFLPSGDRLTIGSRYKDQWTMIGGGTFVDHVGNKSEVLKFPEDLNLAGNTEFYESDLPLTKSNSAIVFGFVKEDAGNYKSAVWEVGFEVVR